MKTSALQSEDGLAAAFQQCRRLRTSPIWGLTLVLLLPVVGVHPQESQPSEYRLKAAFLFNFAKYVEWPAAAFPDKTSPLIIGVLGKSPFDGDLEQTIRNKTINGRPLQIKEIRHSVTEAASCHILFICTSEKKRLPEIFRGLRDAHVLTVGETDRFTQTGGMINFVPEGNKIRFEINDDAAKKAGLKISSKLLNLALRPAH